MRKKKAAVPLEQINNWKLEPDPKEIFEISSASDLSSESQFFNRRKKKWLFIWGAILILIIFIALKAFLNIKLFDFFKRLGSLSSVPYFAATIIFGCSTFFIWEIWIRVVIIRLKLGHQLRHVSNKEWIQFSIISFLIQSITPFSIGSEPYNIWWLTKKGISTKKAAAATASSSICWFIAQFFVTWPSFIYLTIQNWEKVISLQISNCYWLVLAGLLVDVVVSIFIFVISYVNRAHFLISKWINFVKKYMGLHYLTHDELFHKYLQNSTFKKLYLKYLLDISTVKIVLLYFVSNVWVYLVFVFSHRLFLYDVEGYKYWNDFASAWNSYHLINVATTSNNFLPLPSSEGSLQITLQQLMKDFTDMKVSNGKAQTAQKSLTEDQLSQIHDYTIFLWRIFFKYLGLFVGLTYLACMALNSRMKKLGSRMRKTRIPAGSERTYCELVF